MSSPNQFQGPFPARDAIDYFSFLLTKSHLCGDHIIYLRQYISKGNFRPKEAAAWGSTVAYLWQQCSSCSVCLGWPLLPQHSHLLGSQGCSCSGVVQKGACIQILGTCPSHLESWRAALPFDSFWKWSIILERGWCSLWGLLLMGWCVSEVLGVCCATSVVTGCNRQQEVSVLTQLCCILTGDREYRMVLW